jgi:hypothetical protein
MSIMRVEISKSISGCGIKNKIRDRRASGIGLYSVEYIERMRVTSILVLWLLGNLLVEHIRIIVAVHNN